MTQQRPQHLRMRRRVINGGKLPFCLHEDLPEDAGQTEVHPQILPVGRRVVNLPLAGQFGARRAPVGLAAGPRTALAGLPLVVRPRLAALFALATELRTRQGLNPRAQVVTLAPDLLQLLAQGFALSLQPAGLDPQEHDRAAPARVDADVGKKCLKTIDLRAQMQRIPRQTAQVLRFRPRPLERVPGPTPLRFPVQRLAVRLDLLPFEPFGSPVSSIRAAFLFLVKPGPGLRNARRTRNRKAVRHRTRARRHRVHECNGS